MTFEEWKVIYQYESKRKGPVRGLVRSFRPHLQRRFSRQLIRRYITSEMTGLELGAAEQTIAPIRQTILSDAYQSHAGAKTLATQFFPAEATPFQDGRFDFVLNEHVLEHIPNALKALREWKRILKTGGILFLFLPHPKRTFDCHRAITSYAHLQQDFNCSVDSTEDAHWEEWKTLVIEKGLAPHYAGYSKEQTLRDNLLHRHVFTPDSMREILTHEGWIILEAISKIDDRDNSFVLIAKKA